MPNFIARNTDHESKLIRYQRDHYTFAQKCDHFNSCCQDRVLGLISTMLITVRATRNYVFISEMIECIFLRQFN